MKNVGTDRYITISGSEPGIGPTGSNFNFGASTGIYFRSGRYISRNGENISTRGSINNNSRWYLRPYTETEEWKDAGGNTLTPVKNFSVTTPINYINSFGATAALKYIYRVGKLFPGHDRSPGRKNGTHDDQFRERKQRLDRVA